MENREKQVINYYLLCNRLKTKIRKECTSWNVGQVRAESIAEHIYGTQMLAIAMCQAYGYDIDLSKVSLMLAIHEIEKTLKRSNILLQIFKSDRKRAIQYAFREILPSQELEQLLIEYDSKKTKEALFAHQCNHLEIAVQSKINKDKAADTNTKKNNAFEDNSIVKWLNKGKEFVEKWIKPRTNDIQFDQNFTEVSDYASNTNSSDNNNQENSKAKQVIEYFMLCCKLKEVIRTGWLNWKVSAERVESIAEHIYGVQMMAIAMCQAYKYDVDLLKVSLMLAVHETEEIIIGDQTLFQISSEDKAIEGHKAVHHIFGELLQAPTIEKLILEFDERKTKEAIFAYQCDKIECDVQAKIYGDRGYVDLEHQENNAVARDPRVTMWFNKGMDFGEMWIKFGQARYGYDPNFTEVSNYAFDNNLVEQANALKK